MAIKDILAAERDDGTAAGAAVFSDGFTDADILGGAASGFGFDDHGKHNQYLV